MRPLRLTGAAGFPQPLPFQLQDGDGFTDTGVDEVVEGAGAFPIVLTSGCFTFGAVGHLLRPGRSFIERVGRVPVVVHSHE
jgi:hypothetical protein